MRKQCVLRMRAKEIFLGRNGAFGQPVWDYCPTAWGKDARSIVALLLPRRSIIGVLKPPMLVPLELDIKLEKMPPPTPEMNMEMWGFPSDEASARTSYGACGMLVKMEGLPSAGGGTLVYFGCQDCAVEASRVSANSGTVVKEKMSIGPHGHIALARDTEGNMIGFHSM